MTDEEMKEAYDAAKFKTDDGEDIKFKLYEGEWGHVRRKLILEGNGLTLDKWVYSTGPNLWAVSDTPFAPKTIAIFKIDLKEGPRFRVIEGGKQ